MRTLLLSSIAGMALLASGSLAAAPMEFSPDRVTSVDHGFPQNQTNTLRSTQGMDARVQVAMGSRGPESGHVLQERRSVATAGLSSDQKTKLRDIVKGGTLQSVNRAAFPLTVGTKVPRSVRIYGVPQSIIAIAPQYRGFDYVVVDNKLLIIDPHTLQIVYVLPG